MAQNFENGDFYKKVRRFLEDNDGDKLFFENPFIGITITDHTGKILKVNESQSRITGYNYERWIGRNFHELESTGFVSKSGSVKVLKSRKEETIEQSLENGRTFIVRSIPAFDKQQDLKYVVSYLIDSTEMQSLKKEIDEIKQDNLELGLELKKLKSILNLNKKVECPSKRMQSVYDLIERISNSSASVLITGESGVGKEVIARLIHANSLRCDEPFVKINCEAIPENLIESELFGYEPGTFTGGSKYGKEGLLEAGNGGTIFLDEIGEMPMNVQVKLLQFLQDHMVRKLGSIQKKHIDIRVIAATNSDVRAMINEKKFRSDLYYRLNVIPISIPSLEERKEDLPILTYNFIKEFNCKYGTNKEITPQAISFLMKLRYGGNIRQLENIIERAVLLTSDDLIEAEDIHSVLFIQENKSISEVYTNKKISLKEQLEEKEKEILTEYLKLYKNTYKIAEVLDTSQSSISRKLNKYKINDEN